MPHCGFAFTSRVHWSIALALLLTSCTWLNARPTPASSPPKGAIGYVHGAVACVSPEATDVGVAILKKGGNAVDAAVATAFALAVTHPAAGNIGGGGFMIVYPGHGQEPAFIDYREAAPLAATRTMFKKGEGHFGCKPVGVPGTVAGLALAHQRFGKLRWKDVVMPAIRLAEDGFRIDNALASSLNRIVRGSDGFPELQRVYGKPGPKSDRASWQVGDRLVQQDLAGTLRLIAQGGASVFYHGPIAAQIVAEMRRGHGLITARDLASYRARLRKPVHGTYRGYDIYGPAPPSSGGIALVEMLNILENFELARRPRFSAETLHLMIEAMRRAYCDRARYLGDTDFVQVPAFLTAKDYARTLAHGIDLNRATPSEELAKDIALTREGPHTTQLSVVDGHGMAVSNTFTLELSYGSRVVVHGAGFLLNDEMNDFNWYPGLTDFKGNIGTTPNQVAPGKRMLSSMTPTIVARDGKAFLVTGSPGGRTIINTVLCVVVNVIDFGMDVQAAVRAPRLDHEWFPDRAALEHKAEYPETVKKLEAMGHRITGGRQGDAHSIWIDPHTGRLYPAADHRIDGKANGY